LIRVPVPLKIISLETLFHRGGLFHCPRSASKYDILLLDLIGNLVALAIFAAILLLLSLAFLRGQEKWKHSRGPEKA
jgi:hypothetical protein